jgi:hypothetical protein
MFKTILIAGLLSVAAPTSFGQASAPTDAASSAAKHQWAKKLKNHKPAAPASDPERSPDKKGG